MRREHPLFAAIYDPVMWMAERTALGHLRSQLLGALEGDVLEVGAGTGANFRHYAGSARVLALEPDGAMLARARSRAQKAAARITLEHAGDERLAALAPASYDAVVFAFVLCTVEDPQGALAAARRVLRPDGTLVVMEHVRSAGRLGRLQDRLRPYWERVAAGCQLNRETKTLIARAGFDVSTLRNVQIPGIIVRDFLVGTAGASNAASV